MPTILLVGVAVVPRHRRAAARSLRRRGPDRGVKDAIAGAPDPTPVGLTGASAFDPDCDRSLCADGQRGGDDSENQDTAGLAIDGDPATAWRTQGYDNRDITVLKPGVGLVVQLESVKELVELQVDSPTNDWRAEIYVAGADPGNLRRLGQPGRHQGRHRGRHVHLRPR